jgi:hypothetical protein
MTDPIQREILLAFWKSEPGDALPEARADGAERLAPRSARGEQVTMRAIQAITGTLLLVIAIALGAGLV